MKGIVPQDVEAGMGYFLHDCGGEKAGNSEVVQAIKRGEEG